MSEEKKEKEIKVEDIRKEAEKKKCPVEKALYYTIEFLKGPMCGRCFPCSFGSYEAQVRLKNMIEGKASNKDLEAIKRIAEQMSVGSLCKKGKDTAKFILEWIEKGNFDQHVAGVCPDKECPGYIEYQIVPEKCIMCGECLKVCKFNAILGEKKKEYLSGYLPFEIRQKRCTKCGKCVPDVCPTGAIIVVEVKPKEAEPVAA
ncbi:MAG: 4Fe-4S binding protein [Thermodesulfovibrionales bacterium]|nr:4Fe-4S binding protein [Thermodesulfovibrionales bacterium]